ncbi:MAG TPA: Uma2 family endonuclease [Lamprocystis sp. (in: g-proteobacteria)]|nr:Uma2 family endonuclease [Lamprocystis sp. (in: g-proteobacteria)]
MSATARAQTRHWRFTVDDYQRMGETGILHEDDRVELIEGEIVAMPPIGSPHGGRVKHLNRILARAVGDHAIVAVQDPVVLRPRSEPEPDIALLRPRPDFYADAHPVAADILLLIEVADSSLQYDLNVKVPLYARQGIPEVWVVDIAHRQVLRFSQPAGGAYREQGPINLKDPIDLPGLPGCTVQLAALF